MLPLNRDTFLLLGLEDFEPAAETELDGKRKANAISLMQEEFPEAYEVFCRETKGTIWLRPKSDRMTSPGFSSASFHEVGGWTFLTRLAHHHIPANVVLKKTSPYALQENLFHEALHQHLFRLIGERKPLQSERVWIPWRATAWPFEKALHAAWVYVHLLTMRTAWSLNARASGEEVSALKQGITEAKAATAVLVPALIKSRCQLEPDLAETVDRMAYAL